MNDRSHRKKNSVRYLFYFVEQNYNKKSLEGKFQNKTQIAVSRTESTVKTDTGKITYGNVISGPLIQTARRTRHEPAINTNGEINPKKQTLLTGLGRQVGMLGGDTP